MASYGSSNAYLLALAAGVSADVTEALAGADEEIDEAFATGGYATPVPLTAITDSDSKARLTAKLAWCSKVIAAYILSTPAESTGKRGSSERVAKDAADARAWLARIASGSLIIQGLVLATGGLVGSRTGMTVVGTNTWEVTAEFHDAVHTTAID